MTTLNESQKQTILKDENESALASSLAVCDFPIPRHKGCILPMCVEAKGIHRFAENVG